MNRPRLRPTRTVIIAGAVTLLLGAGTAVAAAAVMSSSPVSSSGVIDGCWTNAAVNGSHIIVLQNQGTSCPAGTTPISWNQSGPAGPAGVAGSRGPSGPAGAEGPPGPSGPAGPTGPSGPAGSPGANGSPGTGAVVADTAPASACPNGGITVTDGSGDIGYVCDGSNGSPGPSGPSGPAGPSGAAGSPGITSLDQLNGIPCDNGTGTTQLSYGSGGAVTITCATATTSSSPTASSSSTLTATPDNTEDTALAATIGTDACSAYTAQGVNVGSSEAWYRWTVSNTTGSAPLQCTMTVAVDGEALSGGVPVGSDVLNVIGSGSGDCGEYNATDVSGYTATFTVADGDTGTCQFLIEVYEGSSGADGGFSVTASSS
jgi:Collagen triple helix repeat (20 copies)